MIGRLSTYASIIGTILDRGYVFKKGTALVPSFVAFAVVTLLERHFAHLVDYDFTARMEGALDEIARGEAARVPWLRRFYFGTDGEAGADGVAGIKEEGLKELVSDLGDIDARDVSSFPLAGTDIVIRVGRYGPYLERDGQRVNVPEGDRPGRADRGASRRAAVAADRRQRAGHRPVDRPDHRRQGGQVRPVRHRGAGGRAGLGQAPHRVPAEVDGPDSVTLDDALRLLTLPRTLGELDGEPVTVQNGRYGPYVKKGTDSRSLESEEQMFTVTLDQAKELFAQPKPRGRAARAAAAPPLRELGDDPASGKPIVLREGRFGPYVTDGETNASLRKGDEAESITPQRAVELLAERRAAPPAPRRRAEPGPGRAGPPPGQGRRGVGRSGSKSSGTRAKKT